MTKEEALNEFIRGGFIWMADESFTQQLYCVEVDRVDVYVNARSFNEAAEKASKHQRELYVHINSKGEREHPPVFVSSVKQIKNYIP